MNEDFDRWGVIMSADYKGNDSFSSLLTEYMNAANYGTTVLCKAVNAKFGPRFVSRSTLTSWRDGHIKTLRSSSWESLAGVLHVLQLNRSEANRVFQAAGLRSIEEMWRIHSNDMRVQQILEPWLIPIESDSVSIQPVGEVVTLSTLKPLTTEQRKQIHDSKAVFMNGIILFRMLSVFQLEFRHMLSIGGELRVLISHPDGTAMHMSALRSESRMPLETQIKRAYDTLEILSLWKVVLPEAKIEVRLLDYLPPYGLTIIYPSEQAAGFRCLVRLYPFRSSTSVAPAFSLSSDKTPEWFAFFSDQFEKMWRAGENYPIEA